MARSLLERLEELCNVDVDDASTAVVRSLPFTPHNQTSNQVIITSELLKPENTALFKDLVQKYGKDGWETVYDNAAVQLCARNVPYLTGRVLIQVSLRHVHDRAAIIRQCHAFANAFEQAGVSRDRFAIKLPFSGAAASAALELNAEGIRTLATAVFSLEQAIAASQSGCAMISPYFNEIAAHLDPSARINVQDTCLEHPMSPRVIHMLEAFARDFAATGREQPIMVIARYASAGLASVKILTTADMTSHLHPAEVMAMAELGCPHITISAANLKALMELPDDLPPSPNKPKSRYAEYATAKRLTALSTVDPLAGPSWHGKLATMDTDFVSDAGARLDAFMAKDPIVSQRFEDSRNFFLAAEETARVAIEAEMERQGL